MRSSSITIAVVLVTVLSIGRPAARETNQDVLAGPQRAAFDALVAGLNLDFEASDSPSGWKRYVIELDVPEHAIEVYFGALLTGDGSVWVDTPSFELMEQPPPPPTITVRGAVTGPDDAPVAGALVALNPPNDLSPPFRTQSDDDGRYEIDPVPGERFFVFVASDEFTCEPVEVEGGADATAEIAVVRLGPAPMEVVTWINAHAIPLTTVKAGSGFEDMAPLAEIVGDARVVALGEATHGSREFLQLKHRMLEHLVEEMGFSVFAIEANWPECRAINDYVLYGEGDPKQGLDSIYFWTWNTEEVLALIEWMRAYNADPRHERKVQFVGFDMQTTTVAAGDVFDYLETVDPPRAEATVTNLADFAADDASKRLAGSGLPIFLLDLHKVPSRGIVARWFRAPHLLRQIGAVFSGESRMGSPVVVTDHFDAIAFVNRTTRARPVE
jgi:hypothetical protein